jgi:2-dehydropantoate 2-reductase
MGYYRYAIIGAGAVGGLYGGMLQRAGRDVHFLVRTDYDHLRQHGLRVASPWAAVALPTVHAYRHAEDLPACDVVCVCLKTTQNHLLPELLAPVVRPGTIIVLMQNGLGAEEEVAAAFPAAKVAGGLCYLCSTKRAPGDIHHLDYGDITFAAYSDGMDRPLERILTDFLSAGIPCKIAPHLATARWKKLVWNIPYSGLCVTLNAETNEIQADPAKRQLATALIREVITGGRACGCDIDETFADWILEFTDKMKPYSPSMKLDYLAKRPLEIEYLYRRPLAAAQKAGCALPRIAALADELTRLDVQNRGTGILPVRNLQ